MPKKKTLAENTATLLTRPEAVTDKAKETERTTAYNVCALILDQLMTEIKASEVPFAPSRKELESHIDSVESELSTATDELRGLETDALTNLSKQNEPDQALSMKRLTLKIDQGDLSALLSQLRQQLEDLGRREVERTHNQFQELRKKVDGISAQLFDNLDQSFYESGVYCDRLREIRTQLSNLQRESHEEPLHYIIRPVWVEQALAWSALAKHVRGFLGMRHKETRKASDTSAQWIFGGNSDVELPSLDESKREKYEVAASERKVKLQATREANLKQDNEIKERIEKRLSKAKEDGDDGS